MNKSNSSVLSRKKLIKVFIVGVILNVVLVQFISSQNNINLNVNKESLTSLFDKIEKQSPYRFSYSNLNDLEKKPVTINAQNWTIERLLDSILVERKLEYVISNYSVVIKRKNEFKKRITGIVEDETGEPLIGVNIKVKNTSIGSVSDVNGKFTLEIPIPSQLQLSYIGYLSQEVTVESPTIKITLIPDTKKLDEVVVTALGISRDSKALGYSVSKVTSNEIIEVKNINAVNSISGKVAGVDILQANTGLGGSSKVIIRGNSKITGTNQPLYVVDGVPIDNSNMGDANEWGGIDMGDGISSINADDIESISVLKGPAAAALYGSRAGNGVILITTKKWDKALKNNFNVEFNSNMAFDRVMGQYSDIQYVYGQGIGSPPKDIVDATYMWSWGEKLNPELQFISFDGKLRDYGLKKNNMLGFFKTGSNIQNTLSFSGGNELTNFHFSAADVHMSDIVPNSNLQRNTFNLRGFMRMWKKFVLDAKVNYSIENVNNRPYLGYSGANTAIALLGLPANIDQSWLKDSRVDAFGNYQYWNSQTRIINPYFALFEMKNNSKKDRVLGYITANYEITNWLDLKVKTGIDSYSYDYYSYSPLSTPLAEQGELRRLFSKTTEMNSEFLLSAKKQLNKTWYLSGSFGGNIMTFNNSTEDFLGKGQVERNRISINNYTQYTVLYTNPRKQINSLYAFANIGFNNYLYLDLTARNDWSSTLPVKNNSYFYPSIATSFIITEAFPALKSKLISFGKTRISYAEVGGDTSPYNLTQTFINYPYTMNGTILSTEATTVLPNRELKPSRNKGFETGLDFKLFNWKLGIDASYYNQTTYNEIVKLPISSASAYEYAYINAGQINNKGWELAFNFNAVKTKNFQWDMRINGAQNFNKIVKLHPMAKEQEIARASWISSFIKAIEGGSYGDIIGYDFKRDPKGNIVVDAKGLPMRSDVQTVLGNGQHKLTGGFTNTFSYKGVTLRLLFDFKSGANLLSMTNMKLYQYGAHINTLVGREEWAASEKERIAQNKTTAAWIATGGYKADAVTADGFNEDGTVKYKQNEVYVNPKDYWSNIANNQILSPYIFDASYIKLREVSLSYGFSDKIVRKLKLFKNITASITARNLIVISRIPNVDPESTYSINNGQGYEYGALPQRSSFGFNLNCKF